MITTVDGKKVLTDPFDEGVGYKLPSEPVDVVTVSHQHFDHNAVEGVKGHPKIIEDLGVQYVEGLKFEGYPSYHDRKQGKQRGPNTIFVIESNGIRICHLGDLGHVLDEVMVSALKDVHVLLIPVGGVYTISAQEACQIVKELATPIVVPMHYQTPELKLDIGPLEDFTKEFTRVEKQKMLEVSLKSLPPETCIVELTY